MIIIIWKIIIKINATKIINLSILDIDFISPISYPSIPAIWYINLQPIRPLDHTPCPHNIRKITDPRQLYAIRVWVSSNFVRRIYESKYPVLQFYISPAFIQVSTSYFFPHYFHMKSNQNQKQSLSCCAPQTQCTSGY